MVSPPEIPPTDPPLRKGYKDRYKQPFLESFSKVGTIAGTARSVGISRYLVYDWLRVDEQFKVDFEKAEEEFTAQVESILHDKALLGDVGACIFLLRARNPKKYTERIKHEADEKQFEKLISLFTGVIKRCVPPDLWPTVSSALTSACTTLQAGKGVELLS